MVSLHKETARFKSPGHKNELCFLWDTLLYKTTQQILFPSEITGVHQRNQTTILKHNFVNSKPPFIVEEQLAFCDLALFLKKHSFFWPLPK